MLLSFFMKLENSKWLRWTGMAPLILLPVFVMFGGEGWRGIGILAVLASSLVGMVLGGPVAVGLAKRFTSISEEVGARLKAAGSVFGFLLLPVFGIWFSNAYLGAEIEFVSPGAHVLLACTISGFVFAVGSGGAKN